MDVIPIDYEIYRVASYLLWFPLHCFGILLSPTRHDTCPNHLRRFIFSKYISPIFAVPSVRESLGFVLEISAKSAAGVSGICGDQLLAVSSVR